MKKSLGLLAVLVSAGVLATAAPVDVSAFKESIRVACIGDSITQGVGASRGNAYPAQLGRMLGEKWVVKNHGVSGTTLLNHGDRPYRQKIAFQNALASQPHLVIIKLGTNDTKPQNWKFKDEFIADYEALIEQFARLPSKPRIFICRPAFVAGNGNFGINEAGVLEQIPMLYKIAADTQADIIDIHGVLKSHPELLPDRVHPNTEGATLMAKTVFQALTGKEFTGAAPLVTGETGGK